MRKLGLFFYWLALFAAVAPILYVSGVGDEFFMFILGVNAEGWLLTKLWLLKPLFMLLMVVDFILVTAFCGCLYFVMISKEEVNLLVE